jgi:F420H(2)-dependent quinone reductase
MGMLSSPDRLWPILRPFVAVHTLLYRSTRGRVGQRVRGAPPMLLLEHTGAKTGVRRTAPLGYIRDGENLVIVASKGGNPRNPAWLHNLRADPDVSIQIGHVHARVHAREASPTERARLWPEVVRAHAGYAGYQQRTSREIPLVILEPH